jgi:hypothetical protein
MPKWSNSTTVDASNIILEINEKDINDLLKHVSVDIIIPRKANVIVRNYAKDTANEALEHSSSSEVT